MEPEETVATAPREERPFHDDGDDDDDSALDHEVQMSTFGGQLGMHDSDLSSSGSEDEGDSDDDEEEEV